MTFWPVKQSNVQGPAHMTSDECPHQDSNLDPMAYQTIRAAPMIAR